VKLTLHHDEKSQSKWWQVEELVTGELLHHQLPSSSSSSSSSSSPGQRTADNVLIKPFLSIISFSDRVPTGVLSLFDKYGSVKADLLISVCIIIISASYN